MDKITYLRNFLYSTAKTIFHLILLDGASIQQANELVRQCHTLLDEAYTDSIRELSQSSTSQNQKQEPEDFPPPFSPN